ncbi:ewing's tumor-associated antigen 1 [Coturnix japonica]|uniref:ETAA1 activator of ATR kinase n=2 Tax=Coturnix japonica TaxID=93934 RepID=A0A8C2TK55_COTJA|nr:ewing's tumor-associated antigen 1 [Coturnix japonica]
MPGSRRREPCRRLTAPRGRSGAEDRVGRRWRPAECPAEEEAAGGGAEGGVGRGPLVRVAPGPSPCREAAVRGAAEPCLHKTPKRSLSRKSRIPTFSSPVNDTDIQQEIFWDPHSPIAHGLGKGKTKQPTSRCAVEISEIVNRIAPQDEKAACNEGSLLGTWIGDDAIPCTPGVVKVRARTKFCCTRDLKIKSPEEELMKLAKEFDKNLIELDAVHEQEKLSHDFIQTAADSLNNYKAELKIKNLKSLLDEVSATGTALSLKPVGESTGIPTVEPCQSSSQKSVDLEASVALHALFDCSTQKCSGQLSQGLSGICLNNSVCENKSILETDHLPEQIKNVQNGKSSEHRKDILHAVGSMKQDLPKTDTHTLTKKNSSLKTELVGSTKPDGAVNDDFDDWDTDFLADDSFVMQITQNPELINVEETPPIPVNPSVHSFSDASRTKERSNSTSVACVESRHKSNSFQLSPLKHPSKNAQNVAKSLSLPKPCNKMENSKMASMDSARRSVPNNDFNCIPVSVQSQVKNGNGTVEPKGNLVPLCPSRSSSLRPQTDKLGNNTHVIFCESTSISTNKKPNDLIKAVNRLNTGHLNPAEIPKKRPLSFDDWNEPKFSDEVLDMFCESDSLWDANCEDDELLYQVCDDIEKQTQNQDVKQGSERTKTVQGDSIQSRSNADSSFAASKQGLSDQPLAQQRNAQQGGHSLDNCSRNISRVTRGLTPTGHVANSKNVPSPLTVTSGTSVESKYTLSKNYHQAASEDTRRNTSGKWYRSNSVPTRETSSEVSPANAINVFCSKSLEGQDLLSNAGKMPHNSSGNNVSLLPSKFKFQKINSSQSVLHVGPENPGSHCGIGTALQGLEGRKNQMDVTLHGKPENTKLSFKRHLSESFAMPTSVSMAEQKHRKCSQEEIERKKQEALARRKSRMQAFLKDASV